MLEPGVIEHREGRPRRWLRERRVAIAAWIAVIEGLLFIVGAIPRLLTLAVAILVVVGYFWLGHRLRPGVAREIAWVAAVSQALVMLIPVLAFVVGTLAIIGLGVLAVVALVVLFSRRG
ncbi:MAG TPA: hypothetical protein VH420_09260 [Gaiellaceae bacterium]|jgi:hypothetical protein